MIEEVDVIAREFVMRKHVRQKYRGSPKHPPCRAITTGIALDGPWLRLGGPPLRSWRRAQ